MISPPIWRRLIRAPERGLKTDELRQNQSLARDPAARLISVAYHSGGSANKNSWIVVKTRPPRTTRTFSPMSPRVGGLDACRHRDVARTDDPDVQLTTTICVGTTSSTQTGGLQCSERGHA